MPIIIISTLASLALRIAAIVIASAVLIVALSSFTNAKTIEVFVSGATYVLFPRPFVNQTRKLQCSENNKFLLILRYATVLVVFISGNGVGKN